ncbi:MAG: hypothetical protein ABSF95_08650 [Verrucomicrobiota bacterium]|jgi:hypothetical protein
MRTIDPLKSSLAAAALALLGAPVCAYAGSFVSDFNSGLPPGSAVFGIATVSPDDGTGGGYTNSGCLRMTAVLAGQSGAFILTNDLDAGSPVVSFTAAFKVMVLTGDSADGFSFNFAPDLPLDTIPAEGAGSGLTVEFDTFINAAPDTAPSIDVKVGGVERVTTPCEFLRAGTFVDAVIQLNPNNTLDVIYDGVYIYSNLDLNAYSYVPAAGSLFGFGALTGAPNDDYSFDNLSIVTSTNAAPYVQSFAPRGRNVQTNSALDIVLTDSLTKVDTKSIALTLDGVSISPSITTNGSGETRLHFVPPAGFAFSTTHWVSLAFADNASPAPQSFAWQYSFLVAGPPFVPGRYVTMFADDFESYALGALDKNPMYWVAGNGPNYAPNGSGNPWFGPRPPNGQVKTAESGVTPHSGTQMLGGGAPAEMDQNWYNLAYRLGGGQAFKSNCLLDWWFYDPVGNTPNPAGDPADFQDYVALCNYDTAPTNTDYPESSTREDNGDLNAGLVVGPRYQRLSLGASVDMPERGAYDSSRYQARIVGAALGYADGWINTSRERSVGWHHARIILGPLLPDGTVNVYFYIDDLATPVYWGDSINSSGFNVIEINSGQANAVGYFDDISFALLAAATAPSLAIARGGHGVVLTWAGSFTLQSAPSVKGPWNDLVGAVSPYAFDSTSQRMQFFRLAASVAPPPSLVIARAGQGVVLTWAGSFTLQSAPSVKGPWTDVVGATSPYACDSTSQRMQFFRLHN